MTFEVNGCDILGFGSRAKEANDRGKYLADMDWCEAKYIEKYNNKLGPTSPSVGHGK